jgi:hypothetical protein
MWRLHPVVLGGALWAVLAFIHIRRGLRRRGVKAEVISTLHLPERAGIGVGGALNRLQPSCLERVLILQKWGASHGSYRDVIVGVPKSGFGQETAHAWFDGAESGEPYVPIYKFPAPLARVGR